MASGRTLNTTVPGYRVGGAVAARLPVRFAAWASQIAARPLTWLMRDKAAIVRRHQQRASAHRRALGLTEPAEGTRAHLSRATAAAFGYYARYWLESFKLAQLTPDELDAGIIVDGFDTFQRAVASGKGVILALPHLGGWEWAGHWIATYHKVPITVVVEALEPPELFEWFAAFRERLGMNVVPLGPNVAAEVSRALRAGHVVCLLCDRDLTGDGVAVDLLGETTTLPAGPALLGMRHEAPVLPVGVYFTAPGQHLGVVRPPLDTTRRASLRADVARVTQQLADELGHLIAAAPPQWHMFNPNWPSDREPHRQPHRQLHQGRG